MPGTRQDAVGAADAESSRARSGNGGGMEAVGNVVPSSVATVTVVAAFLLKGPRFIHIVLEPGPHTLTQAEAIFCEVL